MEEGMKAENKYVLDVNNDLELAEMVFLKYISIPDVELLSFLPTLRQPILHRLEHKVNSFSNKAYMPYMCVDCISRLLLAMHYNEYDSEAASMLSRNILVRNSDGTDYYPDSRLDLTEIILEYIPTISIEDRDTLITTANYIYHKYPTVFGSLYGHVLKIDSSGIYFILEDYGSIYAVRYKELLYARRTN